MERSAGMPGVTGGGGGPGVDSAAIVESIRAESAAAALSDLSSLEARFPGAEVAGLLRASGAEDIKLIEGASEKYYFSELTMTRAYAVHLYRLAEKNPLRLVAETVREESRLYPRPTDVRTFMDPPFGLGEAEVAEIVGRLELDPAGADIRRVRTSTGALYLYSDAFMVPALALSLAEWIEVGQKDNP